MRLLQANTRRTFGGGAILERFRLLWERESGGAQFVVVLGSTGEGPTVEAEERRELAEGC